MTPVANDLLNRAKQEYVEMPGLVLTIRQASRLWNLDTGVCHTLLSTLLREEFLSQTRDGAYLRRGSENSYLRSNEPDAPFHGPDHHDHSQPIDDSRTTERAPSRSSSPDDELLVGDVDAAVRARGTV
jgi:hypothetical protein